MYGSKAIDLPWRGWTLRAHGQAMSVDMVLIPLQHMNAFLSTHHGAEPASASQDRPTNQRQPDSSHLSSCVLNLTPVPQWSYVHWSMCGALNEFAMPFCIPVSTSRLDGNASIYLPVHFWRANMVINDSGAIAITVAVAQKLMKELVGKIYSERTRIFSITSEDIFYHLFLIGTRIFPCSLIYDFKNVQ